MPDVWFPNLGIEIQKLSRVAFSVFGIEIYWYGIIITFGIVVAILLMMKEAKRTGQDPDKYFDFSIILIFISVIGARAFFIIFSWDQYKDNLLSVFNTRSGGLAIYGGIIAGLITCVAYSKIKKINLGFLLDTLAPSLVFGQMVGRWGNFINREVFGGFSESLFAMRYVKEQVSGSMTKEILDNTIIVSGVEYIQVQPTFLYESILNAGIFIFLVLYRKKKKFDGEIIALYFLFYGIGRFIIEGIRTDQLKIGNTNLPISQVIAILSSVGAVLFIIYMRKNLKNKKTVKLEKQINTEKVKKEIIIEETVKKETTKNETTKNETTKNETTKNETKIERFYIGGYGDLSINVLDIDFVNKKFELKQEVDIKKASYVAVSNNKKYLYCINELPVLNDVKGGGVSAFKILQDKTLQFINFASSITENPCHVSISDNDEFLFASNYSGGSFVVYKLNPDGSIGELQHNIILEGSSIDKERQTASHIHFVSTIPNTNKLAVCDLGSDKVYIYNFSENYENLITKEEFNLTPGSGPRHLVFSSISETIFIINELNVTIDSLKYNREEDVFEHFQNIKIENNLNKNYTGAGIKISKDEIEVYISIRGKDTVASFKNNEGKLEKIAEFKINGKSPRDFTFSKDEKYLLCACQDSNEIRIFRRDKEKFVDMNFSIGIDMPTCIVPFL